jgi:hypothetical protein
METGPMNLHPIGGQDVRTLVLLGAAEQGNVLDTVKITTRRTHL